MRDVEYKDMTIEELKSLEEWMYDMDVAALDNFYYDERIKIILELENRNV